ncbi:hypothetical protein [Bacillus bombysepticus]
MDQMSVAALSSWKKNKTSFTVIIVKIQEIDERATDDWLLFLKFKNEKM